MRDGIGVGGWNAHQAPHRGAKTLAAGFDESVGLIAGNAGFLWLVPDIDLNQQLGQVAVLVGSPANGVGQGRTVEHFDHVGERHGIGGLVGLQAANQMKTEWAARGVRQGGELGGGFLHTVLAEYGLAGLHGRAHGFDRLCLGDGNQGDIRGDAAGGLRGGGDAGPDRGQA